MSGLKTTGIAWTAEERDLWYAEFLRIALQGAPPTYGVIAQASHWACEMTWFAEHVENAAFEDDSDDE